MADKLGSTERELITFLRKRDYRMVRELGSGACGRTVLLHDDQIDENFVCKKYCPYSESVRTELFANFIREIKLLHQVHHPNVVRVFNYYLYPDSLTGYILMEFVDGVEIDEFLGEHPEKTNDIFLQVISGFEYLEASKILHRDIRPRNVMVKSDGTVKIIDLGFGKRVVDSKDFDKSISLNWWCEPPMDFESATYDFTTEVYFVGKLFERIITENNISHFHYTDVLRTMCNRDPAGRVSMFSTVLQKLRNNQFSEVSFSLADQQSYRLFANELVSHVSKIESGTKYFDDMDRIQRQLRDAYQKFMLEEDAPDCALITRCFIDGTYYYRKAGFSVEAVRRFLDVLKNGTPERDKILLANLHTRLDAVPRYTQEESNEVPF